MNRKLLLACFTLIFAVSIFTIPSCKSKDEHKNHAAQEEKAPQGEEKKMYHCPMHPTYTSDKPGDCPICGMKLVLVEAEEHSEAMNEEEGEKVDGQSAIHISAEREQLIGIKTEVAAEHSLKKIIRASARVAYDAELYNAITEYKAAVSVKDKTKESPLPEMQERSNALIHASSLRLRQMGLSNEQIQNLNEDFSNPTSLLLNEKGAVWVYAQVYEQESGLIKRGQTMEVISSALPGKKFSGKVKAVDAILDRETRSLKVRAEVQDPEGLLKPEMYVNAKIIVNLGTMLAIPEDAVLNTGERQIAFVVTGKGHYEPRKIEIGQEAEGYYEVLSGISEGEHVVTSANFLIDSESKLKSAVSGASHQH